MLRFILSVQILPWTVYPVLLNDFATCLIKNSRQFAPCSYLSYIQRKKPNSSTLLTNAWYHFLNDYQRRQQTWQLMCFVLNKWISYVRIPRQKRATILPVLALKCSFNWKVLQLLHHQSVGSPRPFLSYARKETRG